MKELFVVIGVLTFVGFIVTSCTNDPRYKADQLEEAQRTVRINEQKNQCKAQSGQVQIVYSSDDLCWKDGKVILVINGDTP